MISRDIQTTETGRMQKRWRRQFLSCLTLALLIGKGRKTNYLERLISFLATLSSRRRYKALVNFVEVDFRFLIYSTSPACLQCKVQDFTILFDYYLEELSRNRN